MAKDNSTGYEYKPVPKDTTEYALAAMKEKYGEEFQAIGPWGSVLGKDWKLLLSCESLPDQEILVVVENYRDTDTRSIRDNYLACLYAQETEAFLRSCAEETIGSANVSYLPSLVPLDASLPASLPFDRFLSESGVFISAMIEVKASDFQSEEQARALIERIAESGVECNLNIIGVSDLAFGSLTEDDLKDRSASGQYSLYALAYCKDGAIELSVKEGTQ